MANHHPLRRWRFEQDLTLKQAAHRIGCASSTLSEIERRVALPSGRLALEIARATALPLDQVIEAAERAAE
jgi:transcriptional regulator with XRE-family HTH domain